MGLKSGLWGKTGSFDEKLRVGKIGGGCECV